MMSVRNLWGVVFSWMFVFGGAVWASGVDEFVADPNGVVEVEVRDSFPFAGLAGYLNGVEYYCVSADGSIDSFEGDRLLERGEVLAAVGRFEVLLFAAEGASVVVGDELEVALNGAGVDLYSVVTKGQLSDRFRGLRFVHLWWPFARLAEALGVLLNWLNGVLGVSWGWTVVAFAVLLKLLLLPVSFWQRRLGRDVERVTASMAPRIAEIKAAYKGEAAHRRVMALHKEEGVSPFYTMKASVGLWIQLPIFVAVFNMLAEFPFPAEVFGWMSSLAYPDGWRVWAGEVPWLGGSLNLMPVVMTFATLLGTAVLVFNGGGVKRWWSGIGLALLFLVLFYPFPAAMVWYWAVANFLQAGVSFFLKD